MSKIVVVGGTGLRPIVGSVRPLAEAASAFTPTHRTRGKTIIRITEGA